MKIKIVFVIPSLRAGGAERVVSFLATRFNNQQFESHLLIVGSREVISYNINNTTATFLNKEKVRFAIPQIIAFIHKNEPQIVLSAIGHVNMLMAFISPLFPKIKFIGRETIVVSKMAGVSGNKIRNILSSWLFRLQPLLLDKIICQSEDMKSDLINKFNYPKNKLVVINNPVDKKLQLKKSQNEATIKRIITIGRLTQQKGYPRLLQSLKHLETPFHYTIIGDGKDRDKIFNLIRELNMEEKITHIPFTPNVEKFLAEADLYVQGSLVEGFPNALLESCAVGTPVIAFDAPGGLNEIIQPGVNGEIARNNKDFVDKIECALHKNWDPELIRKSVLEKYSEEKIMKDYELLFLNIMEP